MKIANVKINFINSSIQTNEDIHISITYLPFTLTTSVISINCTHDWQCVLDTLI